MWINQINKLWYAYEKMSRTKNYVSNHEVRDWGKFTLLTLFSVWLIGDIYVWQLNNQFQKLQIGPETKHKMLFEKITHRGPNAFQGLVEICKGNFVEAANLLQRKSSRFTPVTNSDNDDDDDNGVFHSIRGKKREDKEKREKRKNRDKQNDVPSNDARPQPNVDITDKSVSRADAERNMKLELFTKEVRPTKLAINVTKSKKYHTHKTLATYDMKSRHRGVFFLVNIINFHKQDPRNGADVDRDNLITLFRGMEFQIFYNEDITSVVSNSYLSITFFMSDSRS